MSLFLFMCGNKKVVKGLFISVFSINTVKIESICHRFVLSEVRLFNVICLLSSGFALALWLVWLWTLPAYCQWCCCRTCHWSAKPSGISSTLLSLASTPCCKAAAPLYVPWAQATALVRWVWPGQGIHTVHTCADTQAPSIFFYAGWYNEHATVCHCFSKVENGLFLCTHIHTHS